MNHHVVKKLVCLLLMTLLTFNIVNVGAEGLSEYLQNTETTSELTKIASTTINDSEPNSATDSSIVPTKDSTQLKNIIELVVAGIVAAALIIVVLVIFLGRWLAGREKKLIKELRMEAEEDSENISSAASFIREQEKETTHITQNMREQAQQLNDHQERTEKFSKEIVDTSNLIKAHEAEINTSTQRVTESMTKIQTYWDSQVNETIDTISLFQHNLSENINVASDGLEKINQQKTVSSELLEEILNKHSQQNSIIDNNNEISDKVSANLEEAHKESKKLLKLLKKQQEQAERSLNEYSERLNNFEEQAYEQFDTSFQVADLARQELSANLEENRKHIETMRRQEEQSHGLNNQIAKNLETLDYSKIVKISQTLDTTQDMFDEIHSKVDDTRVMLEELKQIEEEIKQTAHNVESVAKNHAALEQNEAKVDEKINELVNASNESEDSSSLAEDISSAEEELAKNIVDALDNPSDTIRGNTTVAITDYKMASGDSSTPLSFFRDIQKNKSQKK